MCPLSLNTLYNMCQQHHNTKSKSTPLYVAQRRKQIVSHNTIKYRYPLLVMLQRGNGKTSYVYIHIFI